MGQLSRVSQPSAMLQTHDAGVTVTVITKGRSLLKRRAVSCISTPFCTRSVRRRVMEALFPELTGGTRVYGLLRKVAIFLHNLCVICLPHTHGRSKVSCPSQFVAWPSGDNGMRQCAQFVVTYEALRTLKCCHHCPRPESSRLV